jgi:ribonuclease VapC
MMVVFDAEPLVAFAFDEPGAETVEDWLDRVYDGDRAGYVATVTLAEVRYVAARKATVEQADAHIRRLQELGLSEYEVDGLWRTAAELKRRHALAVGDAYAVAAAADLDADEDVTLLVGADDDFDAVENDPDRQHLIERFRTDAA